MGIFSEEHPYTAVTEYVNRMTGRDHDEEDLSDLPELIEVIKMQSSGITESSRAIRKSLHLFFAHRTRVIELRGKLTRCHCVE